MSIDKIIELSYRISSNNKKILEIVITTLKTCSD